MRATGVGSTPFRTARYSDMRSPSSTSDSTRSARVCPRERTRSTGEPAARDQVRGQLDPLSHARMLLVVLEEDAVNVGWPQPQISLWSISGSTPSNAGLSAFSLTCERQRTLTALVSSAP